MKKLMLLLVAVFALNSCTQLDDNAPNYYLEVLPIESFVVPQSFDMNAYYDITVTYKQPTSCHIYDGIYYEKSGDERTFGIQAKVFNTDTAKCDTLDEAPIEVKFKFQCTPGYQKYVFKFYKGEDAQGNNIFEEVTVPVTY